MPQSVPRKRTRSSSSVPRRYNIREVALAAKVSVATVSRTLQMPELVTPETRQQVQETIDRLGYTPNLQARNLRTARSYMVVALVPDISNPFFAEVIRGIEQVAHQHRYAVLLGDTQNSPERERTYASLVDARQADGLITLLPHVPKISLPGRQPIVNACEYVRDKAVTSVYVNNEAAAQQATAHLLSLGHRDIALITGPMTRPISVDRDRGYETALKAAGIKRSPALTAAGDFSIESGIRAMESLLSRGNKFTAVFCCNDEMAMGAICALKAHGRSVPQDVSVVGFDDIRFARYFDPPLTTVAQPKGDLGKESMTMLLEIMSGVDVPARKRVLPTQFVVRGSTARRKSP